MPIHSCANDYGPVVGCFPEHPNFEPKFALDCSMNYEDSYLGRNNLVMWGGQKWVREDCRDSTNYIPLQNPQILLDRRMAQENGVIDIDFDRVMSGP